MDATTLLDKAREVLNARQVIGDPYEKNGTTVLPVMSIQGGGGGGEGTGPNGQGSGSGGGIGVNARPVGAFVIRGDQVTWLPAVDVNRVVLGGQLVAIVALLVVRAVVKQRTRRIVAQLKAR